MKRKTVSRSYFKCSPQRLWNAIVEGQSEQTEITPMSEEEFEKQTPTKETMLFRVTCMEEPRRCGYRLRHVNFTTDWLSEITDTGTGCQLKITEVTEYRNPGIWLLSFMATKPRQGHDQYMTGLAKKIQRKK